MAQAPTADTWLKEFEEAMQLADDIAARLRERDLVEAGGGSTSKLVTSTRRKITVLGTYLDRLESLLQNPPAKPSLNEEELYRRQDMLLGLRFKTKQMASSFSTSQTSPRTVGEDSGKKSVGSSRSTFSEQTFHGQGEDLESLERTSMSSKHSALTVEEELSLRTHLLGDRVQGGRVSDSQLKDGLNSKEARRNCSIQLICLTILAILALLLIVWTVLKIL